MRHALLPLLCALTFGFATRSSAEVVLLLDSSGDGITALAAPVAVAVDSAGRVFVAANQTNTVFRVDPTGQITNLLQPGDILSPVSLALDQSSGDLYVAGQFSNNVLRITPSGTVEEVVSPSGDGVTEVRRPQAIAFNSTTGDLFLVCSESGFGFNSELWRLSAAGDLEVLMNIAGDGTNIFDGGRGVAVDEATGDVYAAGSASENVFRVTPAGDITEVMTAPPASVPFALAVDSSSNLYVTLTTTPGDVLKRAPTGTVTTVLDHSGDGVNGLSAPLALTITESDDVVVTGHNTNNAFKVGPGGVTQFIDSSGDGTAPLAGAYGVAIDPVTGDAIVAGADSDTVFRISAESLPVELMSFTVSADD